MAKYATIRAELTVRGLPAYGYDYFEEPEEPEDLAELQELEDNLSTLEAESTLRDTIDFSGRRMLQEGEGTESSFDVSGISSYALMKEQYELHELLLEDFKVSRDDLQKVQWFSIALLFFPIAIGGKYIYSKYTKTSFFVTSANYVDLICFLLTATFWVVTNIYDERDMRYPIFGDPYDQLKEVKFVGNAVQDIIDEKFHFDFLVAAITAVLWVRVVMLLRLTSTFGPTIVMIASMVTIVLRFLVLYILGIFTFACIGTLTLVELDAFQDLFNALRTFVMASLGNFDIIQYDQYDNWKRYYGVALHVTVLFYNMLIIVNLLIAIMSDEYGALS